jgi:hypothetical protein
MSSVWLKRGPEARNELRLYTCMSRRVAEVRKSAHTSVPYPFMRVRGSRM